MTADRVILMAATMLGPLPLAGCLGGDARVELAAADSLDALAGELRVVVEEYHADLGAADDARQGDVVEAFIARVRADASDESATARHADDFAAALDRMRLDREVAYARRSIAKENLNIIHDTADGLRRVGVASLSLEDEAKRHLLDFIATRQAAIRDRDGERAEAVPLAGGGREPASRPAEVRDARAAVPVQGRMFATRVIELTK